MKQDNSFINLIYELVKMEFNNNINIKLNITVGKNININKIINPKTHIEEDFITTANTSFLSFEKEKKIKKNKDYTGSYKKLKLHLKKNPDSGSSGDLSKSFISNPKNKSVFDMWNNSNSAHDSEEKNYENDSDVDSDEMNINYQLLENNYIYSK